MSIMRAPGPSKPVFQGTAKQFGDRSLQNGVTYTYTVTAIDAPGHMTTKTVKAKPTAWLLTPSPGARRKAPPWLRWKRVKNATYYNVQLYRGKRKILSAFPRNPHLKLHSAWRYNGHGIGSPRTPTAGTCGPDTATPRAACAYASAGLGRR